MEAQMAQELGRELGSKKGRVGPLSLAASRDCSRRE